MAEAEIEIENENENENVDETAGAYASERKKYVSERGPFAIWENPPIVKAYPSDKVNPEKVGADFDISGLTEKYPEGVVRQKVGEMIKALSPGASTTLLFAQKGPTGMILAHVWFGANLPVFRHSHPAYGDCLYYVIAGEIRLGKRHLGPGSGLFIPNGQPYKYTAGPAGVELLEFRAGGGEKGAPGMKLDETSPESIQKLTDQYYALHDQWKQPEKIGDTAYFQQELELG